MLSVQRKRKGVTSVLAMLYLVLFSTLAVGFYAAVTTAVQVSTNETHGKKAMLSAESGVDFMRYVMGNVDIPHSTLPENMWGELCKQVKAQLDGTKNIGNVILPTPTGSQMDIPTVYLDSNGSSFTASLIQDGQKVTLKVIGTGPDPLVKRTVQLSFAQAQRASAIFDYGVASRSAISMGGNAKITGAAGALARGSVLSTTANPIPLQMTGTPSISGDFSFTNTTATNKYGNGKIAGYSPTDAEFDSHVHGGVTAPEFPTVDTSVFANYVKNPTASQIISGDPPSSRTSFTNIVIKAGANPHFAGGSTFKGVIFIETPNNVTFSGGANITGVIAVQNNPTGDSSSNSITFEGNVVHNDVGKLDPATFGDLTKLKGSFVLAPKFDVIMKGNSNQVGGTIVTGKLDIAGSAGATVSGTVINLDDTAVNLTGTADITISSTGTTNYPAGVVFGTHYAPLPDTYQEAQ
jgi:hypothetical protein